MMFNNWLTKEDTGQPLGAIVSKLRGKLFDCVYLRETVMAFWSMLSKASKLACKEPRLSVEPCVDIEISLWSKMDYHKNDLKFELGNPSVVLWPTFISFGVGLLTAQTFRWRSVCNIMPARRRHGPCCERPLATSLWNSIDQSRVIVSDCMHRFFLLSHFSVYIELSCIKK